jgi:hypothetical protein
MPSAGSARSLLAQRSGLKGTNVPLDGFLGPAGAMSPTAQNSPLPDPAGQGFKQVAPIR